MCLLGSLSKITLSKGGLLKKRREFHQSQLNKISEEEV